MSSTRPHDAIALPVPDTSPLGRVRLSRTRATRAWRALARELDDATDALQRARGLDRQSVSGGNVNVVPFPQDVAPRRMNEALQHYYDVAVRVLCTPTSRIEDLRPRLALAALFVGRASTVGALDRPYFDDIGDVALALVDMELCRIAGGPERKSNSRRKPKVKRPVSAASTGKPAI